jgi:hypothetical protein
MRIIALAGLALALSACGGNNGNSADEANALTTDNLLVDDNLMMDGTGGMDANASTNATTENLMMNDAATNDPDTNLANGL